MITELNVNDVLLGRGMVNERFRSLIEACHTEYSSARTNKAKNQIARDIVSYIHEIGGRFLKQIDAEKKVVWIEVEESVAIDKCMQALRDLQKKQVPSDGNGGREKRRGAGRSQQQNDSGLTIPAVSLPQSSAGVGTGIAAAAPLALGRVQGDPTSLPIAAQPMAMNPVLPLQFNCNAMLHPRTNGIAPEYVLAAENVVAGQSRVVGVDMDGSSCDVAMVRPSTLEEDVSPAASLAELSEYLLSLLTSNRPMITDEQVELEQALMTDDERAAALSDLFGKQCAVDEHQSKRAKKDLDKNSIEFLVKMMRDEIGRIPEDRKQALLEAQTKCRADEFSDARLERFLRCEGMDVEVRL
jgi:hypothetical protein